MSHLNHWRRVVVALAAMVLATLPVPGWTETPAEEALPKVVPAATVTEESPATDARPSSRRKQPPAAESATTSPAKATGEPRLFQLDPNEPARDILNLRSQAGPKLFDGTMFSQTAATEEVVDPSQNEIFARQIRALEQEQSRAAHMPGELKPATAWPDQNQSPEAAALRQASWQLEQTAQMLEEHRLYKRADDLRQVASEMRKESRRAVEAVGGKLNSEPPAFISK